MKNYHEYEMKIRVRIDSLIYPEFSGNDGAYLLEACRIILEREFNEIEFSSISIRYVSEIKEGLGSLLKSILDKAPKS